MRQPAGRRVPSPREARCSCLPHVTAERTDRLRGEFGSGSAAAPGISTAWPGPSAMPSCPDPLLQHGPQRAFANQDQLGVEIPGSHQRPGVDQRVQSLFRREPADKDCARRCSPVSPALPGDLRNGDAVGNRLDSRFLRGSVETFPPIAKTASSRSTMPLAVHARSTWRSPRMPSARRQRRPMTRPKLPHDCHAISPVAPAPQDEAQPESPTAPAPITLYASCLSIETYARSTGFA